MNSANKVVVIGLDCLEPSLLFGQFRGRLPNLEALMARGVSGRLRSCDPPITVPAWTSMLTSKDPGTLGIYGFRNRSDHSYDKLSFATANSVREPRVWDYLGQAGKQVITLGVPQTYPVKAVNGIQVSCFLTPSIDSIFTYPASVKHEIKPVIDPYMFDVPDFRTEDKGHLRDEIYRMTEGRFKLARHFLRTKPWDFFMMVEMGTDRIHHGFWKFMDPQHRQYIPGNPWQHVIRDYYEYVDCQIGILLEELPDDVTILVVSDHGAKAMEGGVCINEWLIQKGYLVLREYPKQRTRFADLKVDWGRTRVWADGGYYGRVFLNVCGREPQGTIPLREYAAFRDKLAREIEEIPDENGGSLGTVCLKPQDLYHTVNGVAPDLITYFGDLRWRSVGSVGERLIHTFENDTGPDDANHAAEGVFILSGPDLPENDIWSGGQLMDIAPTLLRLFDQPIPADMQGQAFPFVLHGNECCPLQEVIDHQI